jgi:tRNA(Ile)-lysidine synthetase-like protein
VDANALLNDAAVCAGNWAVGVSGGADSVALLCLLINRPGVHLHVVHLDHQTRGDASTGDAEFTSNLARELGVPSTIARRDEIEARLKSLPKNPSARYRAVRLELFRRVIEREKLAGVILAHHADDQAETIFLRLLRGSGPRGLAGMKRRGSVGGVTILRPLLEVRKDDLREFLASRKRSWREDASNQSERYARNRVRMFLESRPELIEQVLAVGRTCRDYLSWIKAHAPQLARDFPAIALADVPRVLGRESARRWLRTHGVPAEKLDLEAIDRLRAMAADAALPGKQLFAGNISVTRRRGWIGRT